MRNGIAPGSCRRRRFGKCSTVSSPRPIMFQVDWSDDSLADLCQIYLDHSTHRKEIRHAADRVEMLLNAAARSAGTEISSEGLRKLRFEPLEAVYSIDGVQAEIQSVRWIGFAIP